MKKKLVSFISITVCVTMNIVSSYAQCTFLGLNANYCTNSAASTLSPGVNVTGGTFSGPGVLNNVFSPSVAGPGTHTINYSTCSPTYAVSQITFAPSSTLGTGVASTAFAPNPDDGLSGLLPIGFTFRFFCNS